MRSVYGFCLSLALALFPGLVEAHAIGLSSGEYRIEDQRLVATLAFARTEWLAVIPELDVDADGDLSSAEIIAGKAALGEVLLPGVEVRSAGSACPGKVNRIEAIEGNGLEIESSYECPASDRVFQVKLTLFDKLSFGHRHLAHQASTPADATQVLFQTQPEFLVSSDSSLSPAATDVASVFQLGVSHILTGYDHLVFLLGLILVGRRLMPLMILVSAFTAGHMLSFGLAALDLVVPDPGLIEPAIALTIAYVGVENWLVKDLSHRWVLAFRRRYARAECAVRSAAIVVDLLQSGRGGGTIGSSRDPAADTLVVAQGQPVRALRHPDPEQFDCRRGGWLVRRTGLGLRQAKVALKASCTSRPALECR